MGRMPAGGAAVSAPFGSKDQLQRALVDLGGRRGFDAEAIDGVLEAWANHRELPSRTRAAGGRNGCERIAIDRNRSNELSKILIGPNPDYTTSSRSPWSGNCQTFSRWIPGQPPKQCARHYVCVPQEAARIARVCTVARAALPDQPSERGGRRSTGTTTYTSLLLEIADRGGVTRHFEGIENRASAVGCWTQRKLLKPFSTGRSTAKGCPPFDALAEPGGLRQTIGTQPESPPQRQRTKLSRTLTNYVA